MSDRLPVESLAAAALTLARRFAAGATMWCASPEWPSHGRHVAVEFVHPVIIGKRALPAVNLDEPDITRSLRILARPGDVLLSLGTARGSTATLMRRAEAWGLNTIWLGAGTRPDPTAASHVIWSEGPDPGRASRSGDLVILYHLLWELTHVVFEHPGLLSADPGCGEDVCITCGDHGQIAEIVEVHGGGQAEVVVEGRREMVDVSLVGSVSREDLILVHAGTALTTLEGAGPEGVG
jgi:hypothetical protein